MILRNLSSSSNSSVLGLFKLLIILVSIFLIVAPQSVLAYQKVPTDQNVPQLLRVSWLAACMSNFTPTHIKALEGSFGDRSTHYNSVQDIGMIIPESDEASSINCNRSNDPTKNNAVLSSLGNEGTLYDLYIKMVDKGVCSNENSKFSCEEGETGDGKGESKLTSALIDIFGLSKLSGADKYYLALNTFIKGCNATRVANPDSALLSGVKSESPDDNLYYIRDPDGTESVYRASLGRGKNITVHNASLGWDREMNCQLLATYASDETRNGATGFYSDYERYLIEREDAGEDNVPVDIPEGGEEGATTTSSCSIEGVGWIVCPVMNFMGKLTDGMFGFISSALSVDSGLVKTDSGTYRGWQIMRNFANAGLVIVFIIIIMSQLTSMGISNYGVKKMLPRLVIAAILINVSFFIAQLAVDLSNMLGFSLKSVFESAAVFNDAWAGQNTIGDVVGQILAGGAIGALGVGAAVLSVGSAFYFGGVGLLVVILLSGLLAVAVLFLIITARMALIVVLVVVAPLAFLAMVLPNTKSWFDKWSKLFISLLVVFPMLSVLFGASKMASNIIIQNAVSSSGDDLTIGIAANNGTSATPIPIIKSSLNTVPVLGKMASRINGFRPGRAAMSKGVKASREGLSGMTKNAALAGRFGKFGKSMAAGGARRTRRAQNVQGEIARSEAELLANQTLSDSGATDRQKASAYASLSKLEDEEIAAIQSLDKRNNMSNEDHLNRLSSDDPKISSAQRIASIRAVSKAGGQGDKNNLARLSSLAHLSEGERAEIAEQTAIGMGAKNPAFGGISIAEISKGSFNSDNAYARYAASNDFTAESFVSMHDNARSEMLASLSTKSADSASTKGMARVLEQYENASDDFKAKVNPAVIEALRKSIETSQANITPTLNVPVATQDSTSSQGDPGGTQFNVPR